ncbi:hypothetical protein D9V30_00035 [Mycetocola reblochoni]|uniref:Uncharacterized protein n=3 Tax=Mycetocola reblochoni TaxID=331618 RepID=A0A1R4IMG4_9MICO|nr:hypothetical protein D9V30_00035 [Mycetocola reblochoni]SJN20949.1 hypothetical protein FM119_02530 [Mycetocola reblochoni REB411]
MFYIGLGDDEVAPGKFTGLALFHDDGFIKQNGEGWVPVSHQIIQTDHGVVLSVMCNREVALGSN